MHKDHTCWYSHETLCGLLTRHGYRIEEDMFSLLRSSDFRVKSGKTLLRRLLYARTLRFSKCLVVVVSSTRAS